MKNAGTFLLVVVAGLWAIGCDQGGSEQTAAPSGSPAPEAADEASQGAAGLLDKAKGAGQAVTEKGSELLEGGKEKLDEALSQDGGGLSLDSFKAGDTLSTEQADSAFATLKKLIEGNNLGDAGQWITKLESVGLPEGYAEKLAGLKDLWTKAKGLGGGDLGNALKGIGG